MQTEIPPASLEKGNAIFHKVKEKEKHLLDGRREPSRTFRSRLTRNDKTRIFISPPKIFKKYNRINRIDVATSGMADALVNHSWIYSIRGPIRFHIEGKWITRRSRFASYYRISRMRITLLGCASRRHSFQLSKFNPKWILNFECESARCLDINYSGTR